jgi:hypothetical protein
VSVASLNHRGAGYGSEPCRRQLQRIAATGGTWVAFNDFAWMADVNRPQVRFAGEGRSNEGDLAQAIRDAHACGLKVLVKPHIWSNQFWNNVKWHGDIAMTTDADWDEWFKQYGAYVLNNAK